MYERKERQMVMPWTPAEAPKIRSSDGMKDIRIVEFPIGLRRASLVKHIELRSHIYGPEERPQHDQNGD